MAAKKAHMLAKSRVREPIQSNISRVGSTLLFAGCKIVLWFTTFPEYILDIKVSL